MLVQRSLEHGAARADRQRGPDDPPSAPPSIPPIIINPFKYEIPAPAIDPRVPPDAPPIVPPERPRLRMIS